MGYHHLQAGEIKTAVEIIKLNVTAFPESPNAYDSLSDVYLADGQKNWRGRTPRRRSNSWIPTPAFVPTYDGQVDTYVLNP